MHKIDFKVGQQLFIPRIFSDAEHESIVVLKVGRKFIHVVNKLFYNTDSEADMTFKVDAETLQTKGVGSSYSRTVYQNEEQYNHILDMQKKRDESIQKIKAIKWADVSDEKITQILRMLDE